MDAVKNANFHPCIQVSLSRQLLIDKSKAQRPGCLFQIDIEKDASVQNEFNVQAVPHLLFFKEGKLVDRVEGADPSIVVEKLEALAKDAPAKKEMSVNERIEKLITSAKVLLFMKGSPEAPRCGFSSKVVSALQSENITFSTFDILQDEAIRQGLKAYSCWPTYPQLYAGKEFMGGCDIILELKENGQLQSEIIQKAGEGVVKESMQERCKRLTRKGPVVVFMKGTPSACRCKFSARVVELLNEDDILFDYFDILEDESVRQELKKYSQWPTYPQIYAHGEFIGGCDIIQELHSKGELKSRLAANVPSQI